MIVLAVVIVAALGIAVYLLIVVRAVPGAVEERFGKVDLPRDIGTWKVDEASEDAKRARANGLEREERLWLDDHGRFGAKRFLEQVRYRDTRSGEIVRVEPDRVRKIKRTRV